MAVSTKSTLIGFTSSNSSLLTRKVIPFSLKVSSFSCGSSRAIPSAGPDHPPSFIVILMEGGLSFSLMNCLITSPAFSDTSNISNSFNKFIAVTSYSVTLLNHIHLFLFVKLLRCIFFVLFLFLSSITLLSLIFIRRDQDDSGTVERRSAIARTILPN